MKDGYYTSVNGFEYRIEQRPCTNANLNEGPGYTYPYKSSLTPKYETVIITNNSEAIDDTFSFDEMTGQYIKAIDSGSIKDVKHYSILYYYKGHQVGRLGGRDNRIDIYLDYKDKAVAIELGFKEFDRTGFIKNVDISEVEMKQDGPYLASWR